MREIEIGRTQSLEVLRRVPMGIFLGDPDDPEGAVLLPRRWVPSGVELGDVLDVFVYTDSEDRPIATTDRPIGEVGDFATLEVVSANRSGVFLDWGLPKDLLLPFKHQLGRARRGDRLVVYIDLDPHTARPIASQKVERVMGVPPSGLAVGQAVDVLIYEKTDLGFKAIVEQSFPGLIYSADVAGAAPNAARSDLTVGARLTGYVQQIRDDGKIDLGLHPSGRAGADLARERVLAELTERNGRLELTDRSDPDEIHRVLGLSKKAFKRAIGGLYRDRLVRLTDTAVERTDAELSESRHGSSSD